MRLQEKFFNGLQQRRIQVVRDNKTGVDVPLSVKAWVWVREARRGAEIFLASCWIKSSCCACCNISARLKAASDSLASSKDTNAHTAKAMKIIRNILVSLVSIFKVVLGNLLSFGSMADYWRRVANGNVKKELR